MGLSALGSIGGSALGGLIGGGDKPEVPKFVPVDIEKEQAKTIGQNIASVKKSAELGQKVDAASYQNAVRLLDMAFPGQFDQAKQTSASLMRGEIPQDVARRINEASAATAFQGGFQGSGLAGNLRARDLGLTSLQLQQQGFGQFQQLAGMMPRSFDLTSMFFSPQQRLQHAVNERNQKFQRDMIAAGISAAPSPQQSALGQGIAQFGQTIGQMGMFQAGRAWGQGDQPLGESGGIPTFLQRPRSSVGEFGSGYMGPPAP